MRFSLIVRLALMAVLMGGFAMPAHAVDCSNAQIRANMTADAGNLAKQRINSMTSGWQKQPSFNSLYCGANFSSMFDQLGANLGGAIFSMIQNLLTNLMSQACAAAVAPIQNAASQLCIPFFSAANFNLSLGLPGTNMNFCSGMQLLNVTPVMGGSSSGGGMNRIPLLP
jgi:hypothetical protein